jgi:hypothetical protein
MSDQPRPLDGLSLLDQLRPPPGYRTTWAVGTTYSLDLVACVAALVALDGRARDTTGFNVPSALRALGNLRDRVRIFAQQGCIHHSPKSNPRVLALYDSIVRAVPFDLAHQAFHPKVWVVRQDPAPDRTDDVPRFLLLVGSRNLTRDTSWDLGIALEGAPGKSTNVDGVRAFIEHVTTLGGEEGFRARDVRALDGVEWGDLPRGIKALHFAWHGGDRRPRSTEDGHPLGLPVGQKLLVLTPFLSEHPIAQLAKKWQHVDLDNKLLLAGLEELRQVARKASTDLTSLRACWVGISRDEPSDELGEESAQPPSHEDDAEALDQDRGLHAKVIAVWTGKKAATVLFGSANLTNPAWNAANCEAWVIAEGNAELADALWAWAAKRANRFDALAEVALPLEDDEAEALEDAHHLVSARAFRLEEPDGVPPVLRVEPALTSLQLRGVTLRVARLSTPDREVLWSGPTATEMPTCDASERTRFLRLQLKGKTRTKTWIQAIEVAPPLQVERDAKALRHLLGPEQFLYYLWACLDERRDDGDEGEGGGEKGADGRSGWSGRTTDRPLRLEALLHAISRSHRAGQTDTLRHLDRTISDYRSGTTFASAQRLAELFEAWDAIREAMPS